MYFQGFVVPVMTAKKQAYLDMAKKWHRSSPSMARRARLNAGVMT